MRIDQIHDAQGILEKRVKLPQEFGVSDYVWPFQDYRDVLELCSKYSLLILGGDIIIKNKDQFSIESSSWYYNGRISCDSINIAKKYLERYPSDENTFVLFVFGE